MSVVLFILLVVHSVEAQDTRIVFQPNAQIGSIGFRFTDAEDFAPPELSRLLQSKGRGSLYEFRRLLGKLPLLNEPASHRFDPVELQKDVVRLRRFYQQSGFPQADIDYEVRVNAEGTVVNVVFLIDEGAPVTLRSIGVVDQNGNTLVLPDSLIAAWRTFQADLDTIRGHRFGDAQARAAELETTQWLRDRGYPFATVRSSSVMDTAQHAIDVTLQVDVGARSRIGPITIEGHTSVSDRVILRELPFRTGDWYSAAALTRGRKRLQNVSLFSQSRVDVDSTLTSDSTLPVHVRILETRPRLTLLELGYISDGPGVTGRVEWTSPNFTGGARSLTSSLEAQSGAGAIGVEPDQLARASLTLTQPYVLAPQVSLLIGPFAEYRDNTQDRSAALGLTATLVYRLGPLSSIALQYQYSGRHIYEYRFGDLSVGDVSLIELLTLQFPSLIDSLGREERKSSFTLAASWDLVDNLANPRRGWLLRPRVEVTVPAGLTTVQFARVDVSVSRFYPLSSKLVLAGRLSLGRLFPFGKSVPVATGSPAFSFIRLRDEVMVAGGTGDVRGWGSRLLGPLVPNVEAQLEGTDTVLVADDYAPTGGLAKASGTIELRLPAPGLPPAWGSHIFIDGGKVWTPDKRFTQNAILPHETDARFAAGGGISYLTPVGAIRLSIGYKLNPSSLDVRDANQVLQALIAGSPVTDVPTDWYRRFHLHLALGAAL